MICHLVVKNVTAVREFDLFASPLRQAINLAIRAEIAENKLENLRRLRPIFPSGCKILTFMGDTARRVIVAFHYSRVWGGGGAG